MIRDDIRRMDALVNQLAAIVRDRTRRPPQPLQTTQDVIDLLQEQVETLRADSRAGSVPKARALGYLAELARRAIETGSLVARIEVLETKNRKEPGK